VFENKMLSAIPRLAKQEARRSWKSYRMEIFIFGVLYQTFYMDGT